LCSVRLAAVIQTISQHDDRFAAFQRFQFVDGLHQRVIHSCIVLRFKLVNGFQQLLCIACYGLRQLEAGVERQQPHPIIGTHLAHISSGGILGSLQLMVGVHAPGDIHHQHGCERVFRLTHTGNTFRLHFDAVLAESNAGRLHLHRLTLSIGNRHIHGYMGKLGGVYLSDAHNQVVVCPDGVNNQPQADQQYQADPC